MSARRDVAEAFAAIQAQALEERVPVIKPRGGGSTRVLRTDSGRVVTHGDVLRGLLKKEDVNAQVQDSKKAVPRYVVCEVCKKPVAVKKPPLSRGHRQCLQKRVWGNCIVCGKGIKREAWQTTKKCKSCGLRKPRDPSTFIDIIGLVLNDWKVLGIAERSSAKNYSRRYLVECVLCAHQCTMLGAVLRRGSYHRLCPKWPCERTAVTIGAPTKWATESRAT